MRMAVVVALTLLGLAPRSSAADPVAADKPAPLTDAASRMKVPEGFRVSLFAGEPAVTQPIAFTFDDRGRMWVVECRSYPNWNREGKGNDRVVILEDTDGDGVHDKRTVFLDNGSNLSGIELGFGGVWLCSVPNLIFIPDRDGDDKPDGPAEVVLDGWNLKDTKHNIFNSLGWGPDGWLYGCNGIQSKSYIGKPGTPEKDRTYMDCGVWRYHPTKKIFEPYAWGTTNPFGLDWDEYGQLFITNCVIDHLWHAIPGAHFQRMYGQDANPYIFDTMKSTSDHKHWAGGHWTASRGNNQGVNTQHSDAGGGHAHSGCAVYLGDNFPPEYRNNLFMCNIHGNRLNRDILYREGSGYVGKHGPDFLFANDPWFRGICVKTGPDGGLYVSDWTDTGECHNYIVADTSNGRIYRVTYGSPKTWQGDLSKLTDAELVKLQLHKNDWFARHARRVLQERAAAGKLSAEVGPLLTQSLTAAATTPDELRLVWTMHNTGILSENVLQLLLKHSNAAVRSWAIVLATESRKPSADVLKTFQELAAKDSSAYVRMYLASAMQRLSAPDSLAVVAGLFSHPEDNADHNLSAMYWYGIQPAVLAMPGESLALMSKIQISRVREYIPRLVLTMDSSELSLDSVLKTLTSDVDDATRRDVLRGIRDGLTGRNLKPSAVWNSLYTKLTTSPSNEVRDLAEEVGLLFNDPKALTAIKTRITDTKVAPANRQAAIARLVSKKVPDLGPTLRTLLADSAVRAAAIRALAAYPDAENSAAILKLYATLPATEKADAVQTLASRPAFATVLLEAVEKGTIPKADVTVFTARQIIALNDKAVSQKLEKVWGVVRPASATRKEQAAKLKTLLTADTLKTADLVRGRAVFTKSCAACHKLFGEGGDVGPELTGSQRANLDYVLENVLDPSAVVPGEYRMTAFHLADGRVLTGIVKKETPQAVTIRTVNEEITVQVTDIDSRKQTPLSIMPDGLFDTMKEDEVRDLVAYLASQQQAPVGGK